MERFEFVGVKSEPYAWLNTLFDGGLFNWITFCGVKFVMKDSFLSDFYDANQCWTTWFCCSDNDRGVCENTLSLDCDWFCKFMLGLLPLTNWCKLLGLVIPDDWICKGIIWIFLSPRADNILLGVLLMMIPFLFYSPVNTLFGVEFWMFNFP